MIKRMGIKSLISVVIVVAAICSCAHTSKTITREPVKVNHSEAYQYFYLEAVRQANAGHYDAAFDLYRHCLELDSVAPEVYYELGAYYIELHNDSIAQAYLQKAVDLNPKNDAYHERLAQWLIQSGKYDEAIEAYESLYSSNQDRTDVLDILIQLYQQKKDYDKMLSTIERIEQMEGTDEQITLSKMRVYSLKGDTESAYKALKGLSDEHPNDVNYKLMLGNWLLQNNRVDEARDIFLQAQKDEPNNEFVAASLYDFYRQQGEDSLSVIYRDKILLNKYTASRTKMTMLQQVIRDNEQNGADSTQVLKIFRDVMASDPENVDVAQLNAAYIQLKNMPEEDFNAALYHVLDIAPDNAAARLQLLQGKWKNEDWDGIIKLCEPALEYNPDEMAFCYYEGMAYYQKDNVDGALNSFRRGVSRINDKSDKAIVSDFYAMMGDILHQKGMEQEAFAAYDSCLQWKPDNIMCLNNYAYYLSETDGDLKKAEAMSQRTINEDPTSTTYLDTYAWILYKEERFMEAKEFIDKAIEHRDSTHNNSTIFEHAGDIYINCDEPKGAVEHWKQALLEGSSNADDIRKKIKKYEK